MRRAVPAILLLSALLLSTAMPVAAQAQRDPAWPDIRAAMWGGTDLGDGAHLIAIDSPARTMNDPRTQIAARILAPEGDALTRVSLVLDENPMPVSAVFDFDAPQPGFFFDVTVRVNGPTPLHVVAETATGAAFVADTFVKTSGTGACAAPPGTDPELALATLGDMELTISPVGGVGADPMRTLRAMAAGERQVDLDIMHPSHSGMQMDQISLLFIPMRYVETLELNLDGAGFATVTGSISLSENPSLTVSVPGGAQAVDVTMTDTDGTTTHARATVAGY
ncbi:quinoprotein dehydrogenase-associated SoxYZ-like carrier [uncultured Jannaschia sp.]|uniref:quinoprotein dehydrogenase-associated SoxYZ-like carrier n=1 Tax=uncultured Jannaschia sp. TaxID=293347 RepID=UPI0026301359|nr:quinoprotein dehydrogenase-associated SoxYZ-like carrier [uncultured Jannaschia sp.]